MENKVYVFLDIDGVLNAPGDKIIFEMFEEKKLALLIDFIKEMKASLVITSSRRTYPSDLKIINNIFAPVCEVVVLSEKRLFKYRGEEIDFFVKQIFYRHHVPPLYLLYYTYYYNYFYETCKWKYTSFVCLLAKHFLHIQALFS